jgi:hypothetical protein
MARSAKGTVSTSGQPEPGDDNGGLLGGHGADDTLPDDRGGVLAGPGADDRLPDDHGGLVGGHGADDPTPHESHDFSYTDASTHASGGDNGTAYTGPVDYLKHEYIWGGHDGRAVSTSVGNVFIRGGDGDDAIAASSGSNVLDGGGGSNFLVGGHGDDGGSDRFFMDVRGGQTGGQTVWDTVVNFHRDDSVTVWGYKDGTSGMSWSENEGADGYKGATLHIETNGSGTGVNASVTFAGLTVADAQSLGMSTGNLGGNDYLALHRNG